MWAAAVLQTTLVLWLAQQTLQAGIKPIDWGNKNVGVPLKPEPVGHVFKPRVTWPDRVKPERPIYPPIDPHIINHRGNGKVNGGIITPRPGGCLHCNGFQRRGCLHCNGFQRRYKTSPSIGVFPPNKWMTKDRFYGVGATGFMGAGGANGYGYGNGYSNGYGNGYSNGHGYSAELADGAGRKSGKRAGPTQVHYDNYHTGLDEDYLGKINGGNGGIRNGYTG